MECEPASQPKIYRPPSPNFLKTEQPAVTDEEPQINTKELTEKESHEPIPKTPRNPEISQDTPTQKSPKTPENSPINDA